MIYIIVFLVILIFIIIIRKLMNLKNSNEKNEKQTLLKKIYSKILINKKNKIKEKLLEQSKLIHSMKKLDYNSLNIIFLCIKELNKKTNKICKNNNIKALNIDDILYNFFLYATNNENVNQIDIKYKEKNYKIIIDKFCKEITKIIKKKLKLKYKHNNKKNYKNNMLKLKNIIEKQTDLKFKNFYINKKENEYKKLKYELSDIDSNIKQEILYLSELLSTCDFITTIIFINNIIIETDKNSEFYRIVKNMSRKIKNVDFIIKKTKPIYKEFYMKQEFEKEILYDVSIIIMYYHINYFNLTFQEKQIMNINCIKYNDIEEFNNHLKQWLYTVADKQLDINIDKLLILKILNEVEIYNYNLLFNIIVNFDDYIKFYNFNYDHNIKERDKDRYLNNDFSLEINEINMKNSFNNIVSGHEFEIYLTELFKKLGYTVIHNGKSGDQGADLIIKDKNFVYVLQAKYYKDKLGNDPVQEVVGALKFYDADKGIVATNSKFTKGAKDLAKANDVILIDGNKLKKLIEYAFNGKHNKKILK